MSRQWNNDECWRQPDPDDVPDAEYAQGEDDYARWLHEMSEPTPAEVQEATEAGFEPLDTPLPTPAELDEILSLRPVEPPPTDAELEAMFKDLENEWNGLPPF